MNTYADWLRRHGEHIYAAAGVEWRTYRGILVPVSDVPCAIELSQVDARRLLRESGAAMVRYPGRGVADGSARDGWYYVVADTCPTLEDLDKKVRYEVRQGFKRCQVRQVEAAWLAEHGYECYRAAHARYRHSTIDDEATFRADMMSRTDGPFEHWAVLAGDRLAGYSRCILAAPWVYHSVAKYRPEYLGERAAYALVRALLEEYVERRGLKLVNGTRTMAHDTDYNRFLLKQGFRRVACELRVVYRRLLGFGVRLLYPARSFLSRLPDTAVLSRVRAVLAMEELRRGSLRAGVQSATGRLGNASV
jgi:hypothetical protein